ncbi:MAG: hypothetical protein NZ921_00545 [Candidatus Caldarchaeum sp.]|nr:hypothetical protein [Candidatus Caldarchaeum sp.]
MKLQQVAAITVLASVTYVTVFHYPVVRGLELTNLLFYMDVWPTVIAAAGYSTAYIAASYLNISYRSKTLTFVGLSIAGLLITYWHLPANSFFGFGVCPADLNNPTLYQLKRISYFAVGSILFLSVRGMSKPWREALAIAFGKVMGWYGFYLTLVQTPLYVAPPVIFTVQLHHEAGFAMLLSMIALDFIAVVSLVNHYFKGKETQPYPIIAQKR